MCVLTVRQQVEYAHTDMAGVVHYSEFLRYMESAEHAFFRSVGLSVVMDVDGRRIFWPRVSCAFEFKQPLRFEDTFEVRLTLTELGTKALTFAAKFVRDGELVATGQSTSVCCEDSGSGELRSIPIPASVVQALQGSEASRE